MSKLFLFISGIFFTASTITATPLTEGQKIDKLIVYVANLKDVMFVRNGTEYSPKVAAEHLSMKREKAGSRLKTAREFIDKVASKSSMSDKPYLIKNKDGSTEEVGRLLYKELLRIEMKNKE